VLGIFLLNAMPNGGAVVTASSLFLIACGWVGSIVSSVVLVGSLDLATIQMIRKWSSPSRSFEDAAAGLKLKAPQGWVLLEKGNPIRNQDQAIATLANTEVISFAQVFREVKTYSAADNVEFLLDTLAKARSSEPEFQALERVDTRVGAVPARRMKVSWKIEDTIAHGYFTAWQDGDVFYHLYMFGPRVIDKKLQTQVDALEKGIAFDAPWSTFLREKAAPTRAACPLLTERAILGLARVIPKDSPPELYCREAYRLAFQGQPHMEAGSQEHLRTLMKSFFAAIPKNRLDRFGAYVERLRANQPTSPDEDREMAALAREAVEKLTPQEQTDLPTQFAAAVEMGRFVGKMGGEEIVF
jgi:hypothetical protein